MKQGVVLVVFAVALVSGWLGYSKYMQTRREAVYRVAVARLQRDLHAGTPRTDVEKYFHSHSVQYNAIDDGHTYLVEIAQEPPGNFWCEPWCPGWALPLRWCKWRKCATFKAALEVAPEMPAHVSNRGRLS